MPTIFIILLIIADLAIVAFIAHDIKELNKELK